MISAKNQDELTDGVACMARRIFERVADFNHSIIVFDQKARMNVYVQIAEHASCEVGAVANSVTGIGYYYNAARICGGDLPHVNRIDDLLTTLSMRAESIVRTLCPELWATHEKTVKSSLWFSAEMIRSDAIRYYLAERIAAAGSMFSIEQSIQTAT